MACLNCDTLGVSVVALIRDIEALHATLAPARDTLPADVDPWAVEARIDRVVARRLITPQEYEAAEVVSGGRGSGAVAVELGLPRWVVRAFLDTMREV